MIGSAGEVPSPEHEDGREQDRRPRGLSGPMRTAALYAGNAAELRRLAAGVECPAQFLEAVFRERLKLLMSLNWMRTSSNAKLRDVWKRQDQLTRDALAALRLWQMGLHGPAARGTE
jgi:hypothetical protein